MLYLETVLRTPFYLVAKIVKIPLKLLSNRGQLEQYNGSTAFEIGRVKLTYRLLYYIH